jgi:hypothetical protein
MNFVQSGAGHAIEIDTAGTYTLTNLNFTGYGADTTDSAAIDITATGGTVTLNISGGGTPTYKTAGATVVIQNSISWTISLVDEDGAAVTGAEITVTDTATTPVELFNVESTVTGSEVYSFDGSSSGNSVVILVGTSGASSFENVSLDTVLPSAAQTTTIQLRVDRVEDNP